MKLLTNKQLFELCYAVALLERKGKRFLIDFGFSNAVSLAKEMNLIK